MHFTQINLHKAKLAAIDLHGKLQERKSIALLTEPYLFRNKIVGMPSGYVAVVPTVAEGEQARAVIMAPRATGIVQLDAHCHRDCAAAMLKTQMGTIYIASIYLDIKKCYRMPSTAKG